MPSKAKIPSKNAALAPGKLVRLKVNRFRTVQPGTELAFNNGFNVILGKNGTGKTTLLALISRVLRSDFSDLKEEAFDLEYEYTHEHGRAKIRFNNEALPEEGSAAGRARARRSDVVDSSMVRSFAPRIRIDLDLLRLGPKRQMSIEIDRRAMRWRLGRSAPKRVDVHDVFTPGLGEELSELLFRFVGNSRDEHSEAAVILGEFSRYGAKAFRFDEALDVFRALTTQNGTRHSPQIGPTTHTSLHFYEEPGITGVKSLGDQSTLFVPLQTMQEVRPSKIGPIDLNLWPTGPISRFTALTGFSELSVSWHVNGSQPINDEIWWSFGPLDFRSSTTDGVRLRHDALSYGQKRLLTFLYYLENNHHFVVADELVNGMHYEWIRACVDEIGHRQAFLTSQNPLLLDFLSFNSADELGRSFIQCRSTEPDSPFRFEWGNLDPAEARSLFDELKVGIQWLNELLRARRLW